MQGCCKKRERNQPREIKYGTGSGHLSPLGFGGLVQPNSASQQRPPPPLARSHHDGFTRQNATFTPTVRLRPINGAAFLMNEVCAYARRSVRLFAFRYTCHGAPLLNWPL